MNFGASHFQLVQYLAREFKPYFNLTALTEAYEGCDWNVKFYTKTALSDTEGQAYFYTDHEPENLEWGGNIIEPVKYSKGRFKMNKESKGQSVKLMKLSKFINKMVATRKLPDLNQDEHGSPKVLVKMDIEGSEVEVIPDLIVNHSFDYIDVLLVEYHDFLHQKKRKVEPDWLRFFTKDFIHLNNLVKSHQIEIIDFDDETYHLSNFSLPNCNNR